jgi:hypothetical protein
MGKTDAAAQSAVVAIMAAVLIFVLLDEVIGERSE